MGGALLSVIVTRAALAWSTSAVQTPLAATNGGLPLEWEIGPGVWALDAAATALAAVICGLLPAIRLTGTQLHFAMATDNTLAKPVWRWRRNVIALQVFASVGLTLLTLISYGYLREHLLPEVASPIGLEQLSLAQTSFDLQRYDEVAGQRTVRNLIVETRRILGPGNGAIASEPPFSLPWGSFPDSHILVEPSAGHVDADPPDRNARMQSVAGDYFRALSYRTIAGRVFDERDDGSVGPVVVLGVRLARALFGSSNAVGRVFRWRQSRPALDVDAEGWATVVGVVEGWQDDQNVSFAPFEQRYQPSAAVIARAPGAGENLTEPVRAAIRRADPSLAITASGRADVVAGGPKVIAQLAVTTVGVLGAIVLLLSMSGLYGVLSQIVTQRRREIGLRSALGAEWRHLVWLVMRDGLRPVLEGCAIGVGVAAVMRQLLQSRFSDELGGITMPMILAVLLPLSLLAAVVCYLPARRAAATDPNVVLRDL